jgi:hypothetical protein
MFDLSYEDKIRAWRTFRLDVSWLDREEILVETAKLWAKAPIAMPHLAFDLPRTWPQPWELISWDRWDEVGINLGIYYTLFLTNRFDKRDLDVVIYNNKESSTLTPTVDVYSKYTLNWSYGQVVNTSIVEETSSRSWRYNYVELRTETYL